MLLFSLACSIRPRTLITLDEKLNPISIPVMVGQAVDVVGQAGKPRTITGFQTHNTPVLLGFGDRAELGSDECILQVLSSGSFFCLVYGMLCKVFSCALAVMVVVAVFPYRSLSLA